MDTYKPQFGWAGPYQEEKSFDLIAGSGNAFCSNEDYYSSQDTPDPRLLEHIRAKQPFDKGWAFWVQVEEVFSKAGLIVKPGPQDCGDCVGYSDVLSAIDLQAQEISCNGSSEEPFVPYVPFSYGAGRVYIGRNRIRGDGSLGSWQIEADRQFGYLPSDLSGLRTKESEPAEPDAGTTRSWGSKRAILDRWKDKAKIHLLGSSTKCETAEVAKKCVTEMFRPLTIASNWGFRKRGFDRRYGITLWTKGGSWAHQMSIRGIFEIKGQWFVYVGNQWGLNYHGEVGEGFPRGGFIITFEEFARWVRSASVYARGQFTGRELEYPNFSLI